MPVALAMAAAWLGYAAAAGQFSFGRTATAAPPGQRAVAQSAAPADVGCCGDGTACTQLISLGQKDDARKDGKKPKELMQAVGW
jgi:hypothetical protein